MDIPRPDQARKRRVRRLVYAGALVAGIALVTAALAQLKPAAPRVARATVWIDTVKRGELLRQVRGTGTLVPEEERWIPAATEGRIERILLRPGTVVEPDSVILELSNPELEQEARDAELQLRAAEAEYVSQKVRLKSQLLDQQAAAARVASDHHQARLQAEADAELAKDGLVSDLSRKLSQVRADELAVRHELEEKRLAINAEAVEAQLAVQQARVDQARALNALRKGQVESLRVRAGLPGVLQHLSVEVGQRVAPGTTLAKVAEPGRLKAELRIAETQAKDVQPGQAASIDTRNGVVGGRVSRVDPAVQNGTVTVDVALEGPLPRGARPDLTVDGTIELERLADVVHVGRPAFGQENAAVGIFRLEPDGVHAARVTVRLGRSSVNSIEIVEGLRPGDQVILSDTSAWDAHDRIRLE
jgi:HlyD family secretion protein